MQTDYDVLPCQQCGRWREGESNFLIGPVRVKHVYNDVVEIEQDKWRLRCRRCRFFVTANTRSMVFAVWNGANKSATPKPYVFGVRRVIVRRVV